MSAGASPLRSFAGRHLGRSRRWLVRFGRGFGGRWLRPRAHRAFRRIRRSTRTRPELRPTSPVVRSRGSAGRRAERSVAVPVPHRPAKPARYGAGARPASRPARSAQPARHRRRCRRAAAPCGRCQRAFRSGPASARRCARRRGRLRKDCESRAGIAPRRWRRRTCRRWRRRRSACRCLRPGVAAARPAASRGRPARPPRSGRRGCRRQNQAARSRR